MTLDRLFGLGKVVVLLFWMLSLYAYFGGAQHWWVSPVKWLAIITIDIHIIEALWFLWWKGSDDLPIFPNIIAIILFGGLHLYPLYRNYKLSTRGI